jgi:hypothetical protein
MKIDRRHFMQASTASLLFAGRMEAVPPAKAAVSETAGMVRAVGKTYAWEWSPQTDRWRLVDKRGRVVTSGPLQPAVLVQAVGAKDRRCLSGTLAAHQARGNQLTVVYKHVNGSAGLTLTLLFDEDGFWMKPVVYDSPSPDDVVSLHYFTEGNGAEAIPGLDNNYLVLPGISESSAISPIVPPMMGLNLTSWLGHGGPPGPGLLQQWGLPTHFFCGLHQNSGSNSKGAMRELLSDSYCCGLADLPAGDLFLETRNGRHSPNVVMRSDLWGNSRGPGQLALGATLYWTTGSTCRAAIRNYYFGLVNAGIVSKKVNSAAKNSIVTAPQFNSWGAEVVANKTGDKFDEPFLNLVYDGLKRAGMKTGMIVLDDKWEGEYGLLEHSSQRFPNFEKTLTRFRADGLRTGMWAAFMRCENPAKLGLTTDHMLHQPDGKPVLIGSGPGSYYLFDFTQPEVQRLMSGLARKFIRRYNPDLVKFDFGYELPALSAAAPKDMNWAGERLLQKGLDVVVTSMKEEKPDLVVMYYCLSPLFTQYFDLHSPDDLFMCAGDYDLEANRRFYFSSLLGELGIPTYGSGGYDWSTVREIWFDSAPIGTLGSLNSFAEDDTNSKPAPEIIAKYNGLTHCLRSSNLFSIEALDNDVLAPLRGLHISSWARIENGEPVVAALRQRGLDGRKGPAQYRGILRTDTSVVVASRTDAGIDKSSRLAIVPYGNGEVTIQRAGGSSSEATVTEHLFNGTSNQYLVPIAGGSFSIPLAERKPDNSIVEWIEVAIGS